MLAFIVSVCPRYLVALLALLIVSQWHLAIIENYAHIFLSATQAMDYSTDIVVTDKFTASLHYIGCSMNAHVYMDIELYFSVH